MAKREAPAKLTGGAGFNYEDHVAARFLIDLLAGTNSLGVGFGRVARVDWQARDAGWLLDDHAVTCVTEAGERAAGLSCKSHRQVTESGFPATFVEAAWEQWLGIGTSRPFRQGQDALVLVTGQLANGVGDAWSKTLGEALRTTPERMLARLSTPADPDEGALSSQMDRALFQSLHCPARLQTYPGTDAAGTVRLLSHVRLLHLDFQSEPSRDEAAAVAACQALLRSGDSAIATDLWDRLLRIAAENRGHAGSLDLPGLLALLRSRFDLRDHPEFSADWDALNRHSRETMADVRTGIAGLPFLTRDAELERIRQSLDARRGCVLAGESGSGKSALARVVAGRDSQRVVWPTADVLDSADTVQFEQRLGIRHPIAAVLCASPCPCLVVFDGVEGYTDAALRLTSRLLRDIGDASSAGHMHVIVTIQLESSRRILTRLVEYGVNPTLLHVLAIPRPTVAAVGGLLSSVPGLRWASLRAELRPVLTNLKVLDWVVQADRSGRAVDGRGVVGLTSLIDRLWERWVEGDDDGFARAGILTRLAVQEAETLAAGVPRVHLEHAEQQALPDLIASDLVHVRDERVRFSHDLLGDWARMRVLVGEEPTASPADRDRAALPRWHRAVRLFGQRLLEQGPEGCERWRRSVEWLEDGSDTGAVVRDLLLEAAFLGTNARELLNLIWPVLAADGGRLLNRLLDRFLYVATVPDPRIAEMAGRQAAAVRLEASFRLPFWPYWGAVLQILHARREEVICLAPVTAARVCGLWLAAMPTEIESGEPLPWRRQAAKLAVAIAREIQAREVEGEHVSRGEARAVFEAALAAAPDLPDEVTALCLELAERREASPEIRERAERARQQGEEKRRLWREAEPERAKKADLLCTPVFPPGPLREPWPDGPRSRVDEAFQSACLNPSAFLTLVRTRPEVALEVLLAVCIEEPQHEDPYEFSLQENCGVEHWHGGYPPLYFRGPFLPFLREAPQQGLSFVLRLVNFATRRHAETKPRRLTRLKMPEAETQTGVTLTVDGQSREWLGDSRVFRWHHDWPHESKVISCALMSLERWLYEQLDRDEDISPWLSRILSESESVAFAGLLLDVGKRAPVLYTGVLQPLLRAWELYGWDLQAVLDRSGGNAGLLGWGLQPQRLTALAREWYTLPHRSHLFRDIVSRIVVIGPELRPFFEQLRADWASQLDERGEPETLRLLIERLNPDNYTERPQEDGSVLVEFAWPEEIQRRNEADQQQRDEQTRLMLFPWQCRQRLESGTPLSQEELLPFWEAIQAINSGPPAPPTEFGHTLLHIEDAVCGGIAVLLVLHRDWLASDPGRLLWCRGRLETIIQHPPPWSPLDADTASGDRHWDAFAAECGVALLVENREDPLARLLVALGVAAYRYSTTALTMGRAFRCRHRLGDDFDRMLSLAVRWAAVRSLYMRAGQLQFQDERCVEREDSLIRGFVNRDLPVERPSLQEANAAALADIDDQYARRFPERQGRPPRRWSTRDGLQRREALRTALSGLDLQVLASACGWLDLKAVQSAEDRRKSLELIRELLGLSLALLPAIDDPQEQEIEDLPSKFDNWVFGVVARAIPQMSQAEDPDSLWRPLLDLATPAHHWVEHFFWQWFTEGVQAAATPESFTALWTRMVSHALSHPLWDPATSHSYDLAGMVHELLGFHFGIHHVGGDERFKAALGQMADTFDQARRRWFGMPKVVSGFAQFVIQPAAANLLLPGIRWLSEAVDAFDAADWRGRDLEEHIVDVLRTCWEREGARVGGDPGLRQAFLNLMTCVASRGGHAAAALRDRVLDSIDGQA